MAEDKVLWRLLPVQGMLPTAPCLMKLLRVCMCQGVLRGGAVEGQRRGGLAPMREEGVLGGSSSRHLVGTFLLAGPA